MTFDEIYITSEDDPFGLGIILVQPYYKNNLLKEIDKRGENLSNLEYFDSPEAFKILHNILNFMESA